MAAKYPGFFYFVALTYVVSIPQGYPLAYDVCSGSSHYVYIVTNRPEKVEK